MNSRGWSRGIPALGIFSLAAACDGGDASKSWSALATCLAGPAAGASVLERAQKIRQFELASPGTLSAKDAWPKRCGAAADDLYAALDKSGSTALFKRKLHDRLGCNDQKGSCNVPSDSSLVSVATELWEAAKSAELTLVSVPGVTAPAAAPPPAVDSKSWKSFSAKPLRLAGPALTPDGRAIVVLKAAEGRSRPLGCEFAAGFQKVRCLAENSKVPELPPQSIDAVADSRGVYAAGLTDKGLVAYNLETGETSPVGGRAGHLVREGAVIDRVQKEDITDAPSDPRARAKALKGKPKAKAKAEQQDEGFVVRELSNGKASKDIPLPKTLVGEPRALGNQILSLSPGEKGTDLVTMTLKGGRVSAPVTLKGVFNGSFHTCQLGDELGLAIFAGHKDQGMAKPTQGDDKTSVTITLFHKGAWSKPAETTMPFDRATESDLVCSANGASLAWAKKSDGGATVGRIDCSSEGCKSNEAKVAGIEPIYFWAAGPIGDKTFLMYRGALGETRVRVGTLAELASAKESIVFDSPDFGGPTTGELLPALTDSAALLLFRGEQPVALRLGPDGTIGVVAL